MTATAEEGTSRGAPGAVLPVPPSVRLLRPGWPITVLLVGYPVLWVLGISTFATQLLAIPMLIELIRRRPIRVPRGFGVWLLFLVCSGAGLLVLGVNPPDTVVGSATGRLIGYGERESSYVAVTVLLLYVGNLTAKELSERRVIGQLGFFFLTVTAGGVLGMFWPNVHFTSPLELVLPQRIASVNYVRHLVHPAFAQVQDFGGDRLPRPAAPFAFTNTWGSQMSLLAIWFTVGWLVLGGRQRRLLGAGALALGAVLVVYSLNRGVWLGVVLSIVFLAVTLARRGRLLPLGVLLLTVLLATVVFFQSPLRQVFEQRLANGDSNNIRTYTSQRAFELSARSPVIGFGSTRSAVGSPASIAIGKSAGCAQCGNIPIGINGYFYTLIVTTGYVGAALFFGFWADQVRRSRRDRSVVGAACLLTMLTATFYGFFYNIELVVPFLALAFMWRRRVAAEEGDDRGQDEQDPSRGHFPDRVPGRVVRVAPAQDPG